MNEVINFRKNYDATRHAVVSAHTLKVEQERERLKLEIGKCEEEMKVHKSVVENELSLEINSLTLLYQTLNKATNSNLLQRLLRTIKRYVIKKKIRDREINFRYKVDDSIRKTFISFPEKFDRYNFLLSNFDDAVRESSFHSLQELDRKKMTIDEVNNSIYGALGEQKVVKTLEELTDDYFLINDFCIEFDKPVYNPQQQQYISSIQVDHLLVSTAGLFMIETKNWSMNSLKNLTLRSPVEQICRSNFALFKILTGEIGTISGFHLKRHHWGKRKIPIRNLIVLTGPKPVEEFQYVKLLSVPQLPGYVKFFQPIFSATETAGLAFYLLDINGKRF